MMPNQYEWIAREPGPKMLVEAVRLYGTLEKSGDADNPEILAWAKELYLDGLYNHDSIPWCGLFVGIIAKRAGKPLPPNPLWARDWAKWGSACAPELGCVLVFGREGGGHVGLYVGEDSECFHVLGGNQSDKVCIVRIAKTRLLASRENYINKPKNVRQIHIASNGQASRNEQ